MDGRGHCWGGFLFGFSVGNAINGTISSFHILFAYGILIFSDTAHGHIQALRPVLLCLEVISGLKVNLGKS